MSYWKFLEVETEELYPWKLHIFGTAEEVQKTDILQRLEDFCNAHRLQAKILNDVETYVKWDENSEQYGKILTIYPRSQEDFRVIVSHLEYSGILTIVDSAEIKGDRELPTPSGRIWYRYELDEPQLAEVVFDMDNRRDYLEYSKHYDSNRAGWNLPHPHLCIGMQDEPEKFDPFWNYQWRLS